MWTVDTIPMLITTPLRPTSDIATCATFDHVTARRPRRMTRKCFKGAAHGIQCDCRCRSGSRVGEAARSRAGRAALRSVEPDSRRLRYSGSRIRSARARQRLCTWSAQRSVPHSRLRSSAWRSALPASARSAIVGVGVARCCSARRCSAPPRCSPQRRRVSRRSRSGDSSLASVSVAR